MQNIPSNGSIDTFFSIVHGTLSRVDHTSQVSVSKSKMIEITPSIFPNQNFTKGGVPSGWKTGKLITLAFSRWMRILNILWFVWTLCLTQPKLSLLPYAPSCHHQGIRKTEYHAWIPHRGDRDWGSHFKGQVLNGGFIFPITHKQCG